MNDLPNQKISNYVGILKELCDKRKIDIINCDYVDSGTEYLPDGRIIFSIKAELRYKNESIIGSGRGLNKKEAKQQSAKSLLIQLLVHLKVLNPIINPIEFSLTDEHLKNANYITQPLKVEQPKVEKPKVEPIKISFDSVRYDQMINKRNYNPKDNPFKRFSKEIVDENSD